MIYQVEGNLLQAIKNYLLLKPMGEVVELVNALDKIALEQNPPPAAAAPKPEIVK